jgi:hypothetical protein
MIREKKIAIKRMRTKVGIKIKLNQILRDWKKNQDKIYKNQNIKDQI